MTDNARDADILMDLLAVSRYIEGKTGRFFNRNAADVTRVYIVPEYTIKLLFVADEEVGSTYGIRYLLENHALFGPDDLILIPDGGDPAGDAMEIAEKNILWLRITTRGVQTHASRPDQGVNAHLAGCALALELNALEQYFDARDPLFEPDRSTVQPTRKEANVPNVNTIPGEDVFYLDCRILPRYSLAEVLERISLVAKRIEERYRVNISWRIDQKIESKATPKDAPVVTALAHAIEQVYGVAARPIGVGGGTVAAELRNKGYHAVVWSRMDETAHQPNEYCVLDYLCGDAAVMASLMFGDASA